jgi:hypothetical protein
VITGHSWNIKYTDHSAIVIDKLIQKTKQTESKANTDLIVHNGAKKRPWERGCTNHTVTKGGSGNEIVTKAAFWWGGGAV